GDPRIARGEGRRRLKGLAARQLHDEASRLRSALERLDGPVHVQVEDVAVANGSVRHGNVFHLHMDGAIETLQGAPQPTGFVVKLPGRKSLEPAAPLAARDSRIA